MRYNTLDPFLRALQVGPFSFSLAGKITPISIRDQMIRAQMFVERAAAAELIAPAKRLLIVGGGAAGAAVALGAAQRGCPVLMIDHQETSFLLQASCTTRWICPNQYDWPLPSWSSEGFPAPLELKSGTPNLEVMPEVPMPWDAAMSNSLALRWDQAVFTELLKSDSKLQVLYGHEIEGKPPQENNSRLRVTIRQVGKTSGTQEEFDCIVSAYGFGKEAQIHGAFRSVSYWEDDTFEMEGLGLATRKKVPVVALFGAGDGALQDFIRITTGLSSGRMVMRRLEKHISQKLKSLLTQANEDARRHWFWNETKIQDHSMLSRLHAVYKDAVEEAYARPTMKKAVAALLEPRSKMARVNLYHPCNHFGICFPLNHFLSLLILKWSESSFKKESERPINMFPQSRLSSIKAYAPHVCDPEQPNACHGYKHAYEIETGVTCNGTEGKKRSVFAEVLIERFGPKAPPPSPVLTGPWEPMERQLIPYSPTSHWP